MDADGVKVVVPKLWGGGDAWDREGTRAPPGRRTGGFTFEYKLTSGRHIPAAALSSEYIDRIALPSSAATERARPPTADRARRPLSARPVGMVEVGGSSDPVLARVNFPAAKKPRPLSASMIRHEEVALTRIGRSTETSAGGRGGGAAAAAAAANGGHVPAPPSTSSPFLLNQAPPPGSPPPPSPQPCMALYPFTAFKVPCRSPLRLCTLPWLSLLGFALTESCRLPIPPPNCPSRLTALPLRSLRSNSNTTAPNHDIENASHSVVQASSSLKGHSRRARASGFTTTAAVTL